MTPRVAVEDRKYAARNPRLGPRNRKDGLCPRCPDGDRQPRLPGQGYCREHRRLMSSGPCRVAWARRREGKPALAVVARVERPGVPWMVELQRGWRA